MQSSRSNQTLFSQFRELVHHLQTVFEPFVKRQSTEEEVARAFLLFYRNSHPEWFVTLQHHATWQFFPLHHAKSTIADQNVPLWCMLSAYASFRVAKDELFTSVVQPELPLIRFPL